MRHVLKKFPDHILNSLTYPGLQNSDNSREPVLREETLHQHQHTYMPTISTSHVTNTRCHQDCGWGVRPFTSSPGV